jgi:PAS domain S-box-containing protein
MNDLHKTKKQLIEELNDMRTRLKETNGSTLFTRPDMGIPEETEEELSGSSLKYRFLFEFAPDAMFIADAETGRIVDTNPAASLLLMRPIETIVGLHHSELHPREITELAVRKFSEHAQKTATNRPQDALIIRSDGKRIPVEILSQLIYIKGKPFLLGIFRDISVRKKIELALQESEARYRSVIENMRDVFYRADQHGIIAMLSPSAARLLGYASVDEMLGRQINSFWENPAERKEMLEMMHRNAGSVTDHEVTILKKDGSALRVSVSSAFIREIDGTILGIEGIIRDITERKRTEDALLESELRYRNLFDTSGDSIFIVDRSTGRFVTANSAASRLYGYSSEEFLEMSIGDISNEREKSQTAVGDGMTYVPVRYHRKKDGTVFPVEIVGSYFTQEGRSFHTAFVRDITNRRRTEEALEHKLSELKAIYENTPVMMCMLNSGRKVLYANHAFMTYVGRTEHEWKLTEPVGGVLGCIHSFEDPRGCGFGTHCRICAIRSAMEDTLRTGRSHLNIEHHTKLLRNGEETSAVLLCSVARIRTSGDSNLMLCIDDITEKKEAVNKLLTYQSQLQSLASQLISVEEKERRRIAVNLHDNIAQNLAIAKMKLGEVRDATTGAVSSQTEHVYKLIKQALTDIRAIMYELSPPILYELGFVPAIEWLAEDFQIKFNLRVTIEIDERIEIADEIAIVLFQSIRELLYNVVKHAQSSSANVSVKDGSDRISVTVEDKGLGFDTSGMQNSARTQMSFGLFSIRERLTILGGQVTISSEPGKGTRVLISVPVK